MLIETKKLECAALNWAVDQCEIKREYSCERGLLIHRIAYGQPMPKYSTDWNLGGPIIDRERIATICPTTGDFWDARDTKVFSMSPIYYRGDTPLIAAMRCYVASKLGEDVDIPVDLV